jgi:hypothetical protein
VGGVDPHNMAGHEGGPLLVPVRRPVVPHLVGAGSGPGPGPRSPGAPSSIGRDLPGGPAG